MQKQLLKLIVILGPTASGKTELSIKLAKKFNGEIISADSRTIYKEMDIGTAKPRPNPALFGKELDLSGQAPPIIIQGAPHYMIDIVRLNQEFTVAQFKQRALKIISDIHKRKRTPFVVGGTMLYIQALVDNFAIPGVPPDKNLRKKLETMIAHKGLEYAYNQLVNLDPDAENFVQHENPRRIIRALEVCIKTKKPFSILRKKSAPLFNALQIGIHVKQEKLYKRINNRADAMIDKGLVPEVKKLYQKYPNNLILKNTICYQEFFSYLENLSSGTSLDPRCPRGHRESGGGSYQEFLPYFKPSLEAGSPNIDLGDQLPEIIKEIKKNTRRYARRQLTWWRKDKRIRWVKGYKEAEKLIKEFINIKKS